MKEKYNINQKIVISLITSPTLVYLLISFLTMDFDITKWGISLRGGSLVLTLFTYVCIFAVLDAFKQTKKGENE